MTLVIVAIVAFIAGMIVMDFAWAWRVGLVREIADKAVATFRKSFPAPAAQQTVEATPVARDAQEAANDIHRESR